MILQRLFIPEEKNTTANKSHMHKFSNFWALLEPLNLEFPDVGKVWFGPAK